ncbi:MAG: PorT family protein [Bacteroidaceae bacterium]|nr:PorT family protein [Bacteroidaceae bacterium]
MRTNTLRSILSLLTFVFALALMAQEPKVQNRPYIDQRRFHYGFLLGLHMQDLEIENNGYIDPDTGEQWYAEINNYSPGFTVGVLGELRLNKHFSLRLSPSIHFGQKHAVYHEQRSGSDSTQVFKSTYISVPIDVKFSAPRYNNFRPYLIAGIDPMVDLTARMHDALRLKPFDLYLEIGMGCDIYLPFFKLIPEIKFCFGLLDIIHKNRSDLIDNTLQKYTNSVNGGRSNMIVLTFNFE